MSENYTPALSEWIVASATVVLAFLTFFLALYTRQLALAMSRPEVVVSIEPHPPGPILIDIVVSNNGTATAFDVEVDLDPEPIGEIIKSADRRGLKKISVIRPAQVHRCLIARASEFLDTKFVATVSWSKRQGSRRREVRVFNLPMQNFTGLILSAYEDQSYKTASSLKALEMNIKSVINGGKSLSVILKDKEKPLSREDIAEIRKSLEGE